MKRGTKLEFEATQNSTAAGRTEMRLKEVGLRTITTQGSVLGLITQSSPYADHCVQVTQGWDYTPPELQWRPLLASRTLGDQKEPPPQALEETVHTWAGLISSFPWGPDIGRTHFAPARCAATAQRCAAWKRETQSITLDHHARNRLLICV